MHDRDINSLNAAEFFTMFCRLLNLSYFFQKNTIRVSLSLDPDQDQHFIKSDLGANRL